METDLKEGQEGRGKFCSAFQPFKGTAFILKEGALEGFEQRDVIPFGVKSIPLAAVDGGKGCCS